VKKRVQPDTPETVRIKFQNARNIMDAAQAVFGTSRETRRERARTRALTDLPIEDGRELVCNLLDLADRVPRHTERWYFMNELIRAAMVRADEEERKPK
jgi:hypothetical protein